MGRLAVGQAICGWRRGCCCCCCVAPVADAAPGWPGPVGPCCWLSLVGCCWGCDALLLGWGRQAADRTHVRICFDLLKVLLYVTGGGVTEMQRRGRQWRLGMTWHTHIMRQAREMASAVVQQTDSPGHAPVGVAALQHVQSSRAACKARLTLQAEHRHACHNAMLT